MGPKKKLKNVYFEDELEYFMQGFRCKKRWKEKREFCFNLVSYLSNFHVRFLGSEKSIYGQRILCLRKIGFFWRSLVQN
jgi:hypothetical protein